MVSSVKITGKQGIFAKEALNTALSRWETEIVPAVLAELRREAPVGDGVGAGTLRDSFTAQRYRVGAGISARFVSSAPYAQYVVHGTAAHIIAPRSANALHWTTGGQDVFAKYVNHPDTKANDFVSKAIRAVLPMLGETLAENVREEASRA